MTNNYNIIPIRSQPGIQRDGTLFNGKGYIDGQWMRFYMGLPRKIGGYKIIDRGTGTIIRSMYNVPKPNSVDTYLGRVDSVNYIHFDFNGNGLSEVDRTPVDYPDYANPNNSWTFDIFTNTENPEDPLIVAHVAPNANDESNTIEGPIYYGDTIGADRNNPLEQVVDEVGDPVLVSGGIIFSSPLMIGYGNNGLIRWSSPEDVGVWPSENSQVISNTKIIRMDVFRGVIIAWTLDSIISISLTNTETGFVFIPSTIQNNITVMSSNSVVSYEQQLFWIGIDQFYFFNGIVQKLTNNMSTDWFFGNVNLFQRAKIWGMAVPRFKEIWWFYPKGNATECTDVIIYNVELQVWYDSVLGRSAGLSSGIFPLPMMADAQTTRVITRDGFEDVYALWMHEYGFDKVSIDETSAILSYFETNIIDLFENNDMNRLIRSRRIEPDFRQNGNLSVTVNNRMFPADTLDNGGLIQNGPYTFDVNTRKIDDINSQGRLISFFFQSNEIGGSYQMGKPLLNYNIGDVRP